MTVFYTSDWHVGHTNIIRYCNRPFADVDHMADHFRRMWASTVRPGDEVWFLGDVAMGPIDESLATLGGIVESVPDVDRHLVLGNHDRPFVPTRAKPSEVARAARFEDRYAELFRLHRGPIGHRLVGPTEAVDVLLSHFPYEGDSQDAERYEADRPTDNGSWLIHGHTHGHWRQHGRQIDVGVDAWAMRLVTADELLDLIAAGERDLPPLEPPR